MTGVVYLVKHAYGLKASKFTPEDILCPWQASWQHNTPFESPAAGLLTPATRPKGHMKSHMQHLGTNNI